MNDRERLLAAVAGAVPGMPVDRVVALLLEPEVRALMPGRRPAVFSTTWRSVSRS
jgi:hypothetical protein